MDSIEKLVQENKNGVLPRAGLVITGHKNHGKGTVCSLFHRLTGLQSASSSRFALDELELFDRLKERGLFYNSKDEAYEDRGRHRDIWFQEIRRLTFEGDQLLGRTLFSRFPVYDGIRNREELLALTEMGLVGAIIWVDASQRLPPEGTDSMTVTQEDATHFVDNNGSKSDLALNMSLLVKNHLERF